MILTTRLHRLGLKRQTATERDWQPRPPSQAAPARPAYSSVGPPSALRVAPRRRTSRPARRSSGCKSGRGALSRPRAGRAPPGAGARRAVRGGGRTWAESDGSRDRHRRRHRCEGCENATSGRWRAAGSRVRAFGGGRTVGAGLGRRQCGGSAGNRGAVGQRPRGPGLGSVSRACACS